MRVADLLLMDRYPLERFHGNAASVRARPLANVPRWPGCGARHDGRLAHGLCRLGLQSSASCARLVSLRECLITDDSRCVQAFLQTNSDLRLFCPSKRIADLVSRSPGRNTSAFLYYFSRGPRPGDWLSNQQVRPSSLLSDADVPGNSFPRPIFLDSCATRSIDRER